MVWLRSIEVCLPTL